MGIVSKFSLPLFSNFYLLPNQGHYTINMTSHEQKSPTTTTLILPAHSFLPSSWCIPVIYLAIAWHCVMACVKGEVVDANKLLFFSSIKFGDCLLACLSLFVCLRVVFFCHCLVYSCCSPGIAWPCVMALVRLWVHANNLMFFSHDTFGLHSHNIALTSHMSIHCLLSVHCVQWFSSFKRCNEGTFLHSNANVWL